MFFSTTLRLATRVSDLIDDLLIGDFDYVLDGERLYADVDYYRDHPHHEAPGMTSTTGHGLMSRRPVLAGAQSRRPGGLPHPPAVCLSPVRPAATRPSTAAARARTTR